MARNVSNYRTVPFWVIISFQRFFCRKSSQIVAKCRKFSRIFSKFLFLLERAMLSWSQFVANRRKLSQNVVNFLNLSQIVSNFLKVSLSRTFYLFLEQCLFLSQIGTNQLKIAQTVICIYKGYNHHRKWLVMGTPVIKGELLKFHNC